MTGERKKSGRIRSIVELTYEIWSEICVKNERTTTEETKDEERAQQSSSGGSLCIYDLPFQVFFPSLHSFFSIIYTSINRNPSSCQSLFWRLRRGPCVGAWSLPRRTEGIHIFVLLPELCVYELRKQMSVSGTARE